MTIKYQIFKGLNQFIKMGININLAPFIFIIEPFILFLQNRSVEYLKICCLKLSVNKHNIIINVKK